MPIYEYLCDDCGARYERIVMSKATENRLPQVRERATHLAAFRL